MAEQKLYRILSGLVDGADKEIKALSGAYIINSDYQSLLDRIEANISNLTPRYKASYVLSGGTTLINGTYAMADYEKNNYPVWARIADGNGNKAEVIWWSNFYSKWVLTPTTQLEYDSDLMTRDGINSTATAQDGPAGSFGGSYVLS